MALDSLGNDVRFAIRQFARRPGLTLSALVALGCGLGAVTTVFTLVDAVILRPLPVAKPGELVAMRDPSFSFPVFEEVSARADMLSSVFAWTSQRLQAQWTSEPESTAVLLATGGMYETLGLRPAAGRLLTPADSGRSAADAQAVAVLSYAAWQRRFGGDPSAIGQTMRIEGMPFTIVGVTPPGFFGVSVGAPVDVTIPLTILPRLRADEREALTSVGNSWLNIMGRVRPGTSIAAADAAFQVLWPQILSATADRVSPSRRTRYLTFTSGLDSAASGYSPVRRQFRDALWLLFGLVCLLLVAACATVANLLLAASAGRRHEIALRVALGAGRWRIARQLFVEGLMLAAAGAALGLLFSAWAGDVLLGLLSTSYETVAVSIGPDLRVFTFIALAVSLATMVFTMAPIASAARIEPARMHEGGPRQTGSLYRARLGPVFVAVQVAISLTLLAGSALFARNLSQLLATDIGFGRENLWVVSLDALSPVSASQGRVSGADLAAYYSEVLRRFRETPGVQSASLSFKAPISNEQGSWWSTFANDGSRESVDPTHRTYLNAVSPGYFSTIGMPLLAGRDFTSSDRDGAPPVVIINASLAREQFGNEPPVGRHLLMGENATRLEVVGVVRDVTYQNLLEDRRRIAYLPSLQQTNFLRTRNLVAVVRIAGPATTTFETLRSVARSMDATAPLTIQSVASRIDESLVQERLLTIIALFLGATSLVLACGALAGLMSHLVTARTREFGLRLALGAGRRSVVGLVMRQALTVAVTGAVAGLGFSLAGGRLVSSFLTTIGPSDPTALAAAAAILMGTTAFAGYIPARRASRVEPMVALRAD